MFVYLYVSAIQGRALATRVAAQQSERKVNPTSQDTKARSVKSLQVKQFLVNEFLYGLFDTSSFSVVYVLLQVSRLPGGVIVISLETYAPVSNLAIVYNAGPRYESSSELGLTHCLRMAVNHVSSTLYSSI